MKKTTQKAHHDIHALSMLINISRSIGISSITSNKQGYSYKHGIVHSIKCIGICSIILVYNVIYVAKAAAEELHLIAMADTALMVGFCVLIFVSYYISLFKSVKIIGALNDFVEMDGKLKVLALVGKDMDLFDRPYRKIYRTINVCTFISFAFIILKEIIMDIIRKPMAIVRIETFITFNGPFLAVSLMNYQINGLQYLVWHKTYVINKILKHQLQDPQPNDHLLAAKITTLREMYYRVCSLNRRLFAIYEPFLLIVQFTNFIGISFNSYGIYKRFRLISKIDSFVWTSISVYNLLNVVVACETVQREQAYTKELLQKLAVKFHWAEQTKFSISEFSWQLYHRKNPATVYGMFDMNFSFVYDMSAAIVTYLIIIIQFDYSLEMKTVEKTLGE